MANSLRHQQLLPPCYENIADLVNYEEFQIPADKVPSEMMLHSVLSWYYGVGTCHYLYYAKDGVFNIRGIQCVNRPHCREAFAADTLYSDAEAREKWSSKFYKAWSDLLSVVEDASGRDSDSDS